MFSEILRAAMNKRVAGTTPLHQEQSKLIYNAYWNVSAQAKKPDLIERMRERIHGSDPAKPQL